MTSKKRFLFSQFYTHWEERRNKMISGEEGREEKWKRNTCFFGLFSCEEWSSMEDSDMIGMRRRSTFIECQNFFNPIFVDLFLNVLPGQFQEINSPPNSQKTKTTNRMRAGDHLFKGPSWRFLSSTTLTFSLPIESTIFHLKTRTKQIYLRNQETIASFYHFASADSPKTFIVPCW